MILTTNKALRPYQLKALDAAKRDLIDGGINGIITMLPTGAGKTVYAINYIKQNYDLRKHRVLWIVDSIDLVHQAYDSFMENWQELKYEYQNAVGKVMNTYNQVDARIIIATPQSLSDVEGDCRRLKDILKHGALDLVILDEAHKSVSTYFLTARSIWEGLDFDFSPGWKIENLLKAFKKSKSKTKRLGLTATPIRSDGIGLHLMFDKISFQYNIQEAIRDGYLCPIKWYNVQTEIELPNGEGSIEDRARLIDVNNWTDQLVKAYLEHGENRQGLWYLPSVWHSLKLTEAFNNHGIPSFHVEASVPSRKRQQAYQDFKARKLQHLTNYNVLTTGIDIPQVALIGLARPTNNETLVTQIVGRGTRIHPSKSDVLVLDFAVKGVDLVQSGTLFGITPRDKAEEEVDEQPLPEEIDLRIPPKGKHITGKGLIVEERKILNKQPEAWYPQSGDNIVTMSATMNHAFAVSFPNPQIARQLEIGMQKGEEMMAQQPEHEGYRQFYDVLELGHLVTANYCVWHIYKEGYHWRCKPHPVVTSEYYDSVFDFAVPYIADTIEKALAKDPNDSDFSKKSKSWRKQPVSEKQETQLRLKNMSALNKGHAAQIITHLNVKPRIEERIKQILEPCGKWAKLC